MGDMPKALIDGPAIDKHCFVYCGDDLCDCSAGPNWPTPIEDTPAPIATPEEVARHLVDADGGDLNRDTVRRFIATAVRAERAALASSNAEIERVRQQLGWAYGEIDRLTGAVVPGLEAEIERLKAGAADVARAVVTGSALMTEAAEDRHELKQRLRAAEAANAVLAEQVGKLRELLRNASDELASELDARYAGMLDHPAMKRRYDRDMASVNDARAALSPDRTGSHGEVG